MRFPRFAFLALFALIAQFASAQQTATTVQRDPQALSALQQSIAAMGNTAPSDSTATGTITTVAGSLTETGSIVILTRGTDQTSEQIQTPSGFTRVYSQGYATLNSGGTTSKLPMESVVTTQCTYFPLPFLAGAIANPDVALKYVGLEALNGGSTQHIRLRNTFASIPDLQAIANLSLTDVWLSATSGLPQKVSFTHHASGGSSPGVRVDVFLSNYKNVSGILYPFSLQVSLNGTTWATVSIQNVTLNSGLTDGSFSVQ